MMGTSARSRCFDLVWIRARAISRKFILAMLLMIITALVWAGISNVLAAVSPTSPAVCLQWDISGEWQYRASLGGYGTMTFQQAGESGALTGSWHNVANGASGTLQGNVSGASVEIHPTEFETYTGTVAPDGKKMAGTFTFYDQFGTWEMTGSAECLREPPPPVLSTANITVRWGNHIYRRIIQMPATNISAAALTQAAPAALPVINFLGETQLDIEIIYVGTDLPQTLTVLDRVNGQDVVIGTLQRVEILDDGRVRYRGIVTVQPRGTISPGQRQIHDIIVIDPWNNEVWAARIVMQLIDPSGYIRNAVTQERIEGAIASCYQMVGGQWVLWNADQFAQTNPQPSNVEGYYGWDVPQGEYKVKVSKACYADAESVALTVPPPRTDVHFNLTPLTCSAVEIGDVWTTDTSSVPVLDFMPGQEVATHMQVANGESSDSTIMIEWTTTDPDGRPVPALTGSNTYILPPNSSIDIKFGGQLPTNAMAGTYTQTTQTTHNQQTSMLVSQFMVLPSPGLYLPVMLRAVGEPITPTPTPTPTRTPTRTPTHTPTPTVTPTPGQQTITLTSTADACILQGYPTVNVGGTNDMWVGYDDSLDPDAEIVRSLVRFDMSSIPKGVTVQNAKLRVYYKASWEFPGWVDTITAYQAQGEWQEMSVTWNNKPGFGASYGSVEITADGSWGWREFNVKDLVQNWVNSSFANDGIMLRGEEASGAESSWRAFFTREGAHPPELVVTYGSAANTEPIRVPARTSKDQNVSIMKLIGVSRFDHESSGRQYRNSE